MSRTIIRTTAPDRAAETAYALAHIQDAEPIEVEDYWQVTVAHSGRRIRFAAIDGEWDAGVEIHILNRYGVQIGSATVQAMGMSPRFVAEMASSLNREIS